MKIEWDFKHNFFLFGIIWVSSRPLRKNALLELSLKILDETEHVAIGDIADFAKVLEDDTDLAMMNLTRMCQSPEDYVPPLSKEVLGDHEEIELLLEAYLQVGERKILSPYCSALESVGNRSVSVSLC